MLTTKVSQYYVSDTRALYLQGHYIIKLHQSLDSINIQNHYHEYPILFGSILSGNTANLQFCTPQENICKEMVYAVI